MIKGKGKKMCRIEKIIINKDNKKEEQIIKKKVNKI